MFLNGWKPQFRISDDQANESQDGDDSDEMKPSQLAFNLIQILSTLNGMYSLHLESSLFSFNYN